ncbi:uncharacterized protein KY384_004139 [Bacidia gigantensis]|uniref:uncharacterized protein n=1 Tax=Bacidia gigantensis TaxID=2732470 RepID=UPI001D044DBA|nr:uncharacterized protein KY384_004139 [Bacidia gigantensis]KAG8530782.1 hypothetical protein KY384_004139 [Bacidia gigantensis]
MLVDADAKRDADRKLDSYTIWVIGQDDFSDVQIPDAPAQPPQTPNTGVQRAASEDGLKERQEATMERSRISKQDAQTASSSSWWSVLVLEELLPLVLDEAFDDVALDLADAVFEEAADEDAAEADVAEEEPPLEVLATVFVDSTTN